MSLLASQRRTLHEIDKKLAAEDPDLADLFTLFRLRAPGSERPAEERLGRSRWRKFRARPDGSPRPLAPQLVGLLVMLLVATAACVAAALGPVRAPAHSCRGQPSSPATAVPVSPCGPQGMFPPSK